MKVIEALDDDGCCCLSFEILPPNKGTGIEAIYRALDPLVPFNPAFINVTYHQPHVEFKETREGLKKIYRNKRPGTVGICAAIKYKYGIETVPHFICGGFNKFETEDALIDLHFLGMNNVFIVRGDPAPGNNMFIPEPDGHVYAHQLVEQVANMNKGKYLEELENQSPTDFCIGVAGYPEKHFESPNIDFDILNLKRKIEAGADYIITQMIFDAEKYIHYVQLLRENGISLPVIPGIKPISSLQQITSIPRNFYVSIPADLTKKLMECRTDAQVKKVGIAHTIELIQKLLDFGVPGIHVFTMSNPEPVVEVLKQVIVYEK
ncbi:MAG: methylenetetrahydrofolate reductase [NAD(P)H] [Calditrichia bacterium]